MKCTIGLMAFVLLSTGNALGDNLRIPGGAAIMVEYVSSEAAFINTLSIRSPANMAIATGGYFPGRVGTTCELASARRLMGLRILSGNRSRPGCRLLLDVTSLRPGIQVFPVGFFGGGSLEFNLCSQPDAQSDCGFIWSSNPFQNIDNFNHVRITEIPPDTAFPGRVFELAWEDSPGGGDMDFNDLIVRVRVRPCTMSQ